jgi:hypothetical protein
MDIKTKGKHHSKTYFEKLYLATFAADLSRLYSFNGYQVMELLQIRTELLKIELMINRKGSPSTYHNKLLIGVLARLRNILNTHAMANNTSVSYTYALNNNVGLLVGLFLPDEKISESRDVEELDSFFILK